MQRLCFFIFQTRRWPRSFETGFCEGRWRNKHLGCVHEHCVLTIILNFCWKYFSCWYAVRRPPNRDSSTYCTCSFMTFMLSSGNQSVKVFNSTSNTFNTRDLANEIIWSTVACERTCSFTLGMKVASCHCWGGQGMGASPSSSATGSLSVIIDGSSASPVRTWPSICPPLQPWLRCFLYESHFV